MQCLEHALCHLPRCRLNAMNEVWVPSEWQREAFIASGVAADKLVVVPEVSRRTDSARWCWAAHAAWSE